MNVAWNNLVIMDERVDENILRSLQEIDDLSAYNSLSREKSQAEWRKRKIRSNELARSCLFCNHKRIIDLKIGWLILIQVCIYCYFNQVILKINSNLNKL